MATEALNSIVALVKTCTQHTAEIPTFLSEVFVELGESLGIELAVADVAQAVVAIFGGIERVGRGEEFLLILVTALVIFYPARDVYPWGDAPVERHGRLVALLVVDETLTLGFPVGILHRNIVVVGPILNREVATRIVTLIVAQLGEIVPGGE